VSNSGTITLNAGPCTISSNSFTNQPGGALVLWANITLPGTVGQDGSITLFLTATLTKTGTLTNAAGITAWGPTNTLNTTVVNAGGVTAEPSTTLVINTYTGTPGGTIGVATDNFGDLGQLQIGTSSLAGSLSFGRDTGWTPTTVGQSFSFASWGTVTGKCAQENINNNSWRVNNKSYFFTFSPLPPTPPTAVVGDMIESRG
jgi:hypothetical protein